jgi:hypothetical protein
VATTGENKGGKGRGSERHILTQDGGSEAPQNCVSAPRCIARAQPPTVTRATMQCYWHCCVTIQGQWRCADVCCAQGEQGCAHVWSAPNRAHKVCVIRHCVESESAMMGRQEGAMRQQGRTDTNERGKDGTRDTKTQRGCAAGPRRSGWAVCWGRRSTSERVTCNARTHAVATATHTSERWPGCGRGDCEHGTADQASPK